MIMYWPSGEVDDRDGALCPTKLKPVPEEWIAAINNSASGVHPGHQAVRQCFREASVTKVEKTLQDSDHLQCVVVWGLRKAFPEREGVVASSVHLQISLPLS